jgi:hypothetical protein
MQLDRQHARTHVGKGSRQGTDAGTEVDDDVAPADG